MRGWVQVLIFVAFIILPVVSRVLQSIAEKQAANREKKRRQVRPPEDATSILKQHRQRGETEPMKSRSSPQASAEASRREELARRRRAQLEAWRAKQGRATQTRAEVGPASARGGQISPVPAPSVGDLMNPATGEQLIRDFLEQAEQHARPAQRQGTSPGGGGAQRASGPTKRGLHPRSKATLEGHFRSKHQAGSASESEVHRLVPDTPDKRSWAKGAGLMSGVGGVSEFRRMLRSSAALRAAFVMKEILEPPLALRENIEY